MIEARTEAEAVLRMEDGEAVLSGLEALPIESAIVVCGIGMLRDFELGYWNGETYERHRCTEPVELVSLQGNIAPCGDQRIVHLHACVAKRDGSTLGGHLFAGTVHNTAEILLVCPRGMVLERRTEPSGLTGLYPRAT